jgi:hypothetical protein
MCVMQNWLNQFMARDLKSAVLKESISRYKLYRKVCVDKNWTSIPIGGMNIMCNHSAITESNLRLRLFGLVTAKVAVMIKYVDCFID